ncbi:hypothetical protein C1646_768777 [Rhizophagus diaphanus]|nr:hypothetical protein C1646_768777 [Rhizophagus diaphanus] [Rhizophagus sp. MUCL 43196]
MAIIVPNAIIETNYLYNLNNFNSNQLQAKITNFILQINDKGILGEIMDIRFTNIQNLLLLENNLLYCINEKTSHVIEKFYNNSFMMKNILLMKENNFDLETDDKVLENFKVEGGLTTVRSLISVNAYINNFRFLQDNNIHYIDQIISLSKCYLLTIKELEERKYTQGIYTVVQQMDNVDKVENLRGVEIIPLIANNKKDVPIIIEVNYGGILQPVFERTRKILPGEHFAMHMVPINMLDDKDLILEKCKGCNLAT